MIRWPVVQPVPGSGGRLVRPEPFGGTIAFRRPEMLVMVDHAFARSLGVTGAAKLSNPSIAARIDPAAPFEAHLTLGNGCPVQCRGCYIGGSMDGFDSMPPGQWKEVLERLANLGVYHLALGGGEATSWDLLIGLARRARQLGMTPNLTTGGSDLTPRLARRLRVFERVHLSLDGVGQTYEIMRGHDGSRRAVMGLRILRAFHPRVGVNCVVGRPNADALGPMFGLLDNLGIREVELLRFKPVGRGAEIFEQMDLTVAQASTLVGRVLRLALRHRVRVRLDCSFTPMVCAAGIPPSRLMRLGLAGCVAGSWLISVGPDGMVSGCSFDHDARVSWRRLGEPGLMDRYFGWLRRAPPPCDRCRWLAICRGGCHVVARHLTGDSFSPDPGCPLVANAVSASDRW